MKTSKISVTMCMVLLTGIWILPNSMNVEAQVSEEWIVRYDGPASEIDRVTAMAVDSHGNIYITGRSMGIGTDYDYATVAYDPLGNQQWVARYNGPGNSWDYAWDIILDDNGNIYVTGGSVGIGTGYDYGTVAYDSDGNELWVARYNGPGYYNSKSDIGKGIALDSHGNVYVTGYSIGNGTANDFVTVAYDSDGNELWVRRYQGPHAIWESGNDIVVNSLGNICVAGYSTSYGTSEDYTTISYDPYGNELWVAIYNGSTQYKDEVSAIAADTSGNVYVTGLSMGDSSGFDYATIKYDSDGNEIWVARYDGSGNYNDWARDIVIDSSDRVYITGQSYGVDSFYDFATVAYDSNGNELWASRYNGPNDDNDDAYKLALGNSGNVYVTGDSWGPNSRSDFATVAYDSHGNELWVARYNGPVDMNDVETTVATDSSGNIYVAGVSHGDGTDYDYTLIKYTEQLDPDDAIDDLISDIEDMNLPGGTENCLTSKLEAAQKSLENGQCGTAINQLEAFINQVEALRGKKLTEEEADALIAAAEAIIAMIGPCPR